MLFLVALCFGDNNAQEELDFLLFQPDLSDKFVNEGQAILQLDDIARNILEKNLDSHAIYVNGYAAIAQNDIDPKKLSLDRALFIINELKIRGVPEYLFSDPVGHGSVNLWGLNENDRMPNRRVSISFEKRIEIPVDKGDPEDNGKNGIIENGQLNQSKKSFPWWILLLILLAILILLFFRFVLPRISAGAAAGGSDSEEYKLPSGALEMLLKLGLSEEEISRIKKDYAGRGGSTFFVPQDDEFGKNHCDTQIDFLTNGYRNNLVAKDPNNRALAELIDKNPNRLKIAKNYQKLKKGKKGIEFICSDYFKNMNEFAYYTVDIRKTLGGDIIIPSNREDTFGLANLATAIEQKKISSEDASRAKELVQKIFSRPPNHTSGELSEFQTIMGKTPKYNRDEMVWDENANGHTLNLIPSGYFHSGSGGSGRYHKGGHSLVEAAEAIIGNR